MRKLYGVVIRSRHGVPQTKWYSTPAARDQALIAAEKRNNHVPKTWQYSHAKVER